MYLSAHCSISICDNNSLEAFWQAACQKPFFFRFFTWKITGTTPTFAQFVQLPEPGKSKKEKNHVNFIVPNFTPKKLKKHCGPVTQS